MTYASGERHPQAKLTDEQVAHIRDTHLSKRARIAEINAEIDRLGLEKMRLNDRVTYEKTAAEYGVAVITVARYVRGMLRG
jgi:uncharacterized protein YerC